MSPLGIVTAGLQLLSSWLMSVIAVLALFVSVVVCLAFVEFVCDGSSITQAYTVKPQTWEADPRAERARRNDPASTYPPAR